MINKEIFRLYDIRGIFPQELNEDTAYQIGRCFIHFLRKTTKKATFKIAVGRDIRSSSPSLFKGFSDGIRDEGADIVDLGLVTTPMLYFAVSKFGYDGVSAAGGGAGGKNASSYYNGSAANANTGSGGGGAVNATGGAGGSGIVIIRYTK